MTPVPITTEELLTQASIAIRMNAYSAMECSNHLAVHSRGEYAQALHEVAVRLSDLATIVREIAQAHASHDRLGTVQ